MLRLLSACDGSVDLLGVADAADRPIWELREAADLLREHDLLRATHQH